MALDERIRNSVCLPVICAPMFLVSGPALVGEACKAGVMAGLPIQNSRDYEEFERWLTEIHSSLDRHAATGARIGPLAVNFGARLPLDELPRYLALCARFNVEYIITVGRDPAAITARAHDHGMKVFHDITNIRFAEKAMQGKVDGLTCIGAGGGGHSGTISHLALIRKVRAMFDGTIIMAGAISDGATIRASEILGADLAYMGTRFIATVESMAPQAYKDMIVNGTSADLAYTGKVAGVPANWMIASLQRVGLDLAAMPDAPGGGKKHDNLPEHLRPWRDIWSAGQGIDIIHDIPTVAALVRRLRQEYVAACAVPDMADAARLVDEVHGASGLKHV
jgi:nitronate monooxygenase